MPGQSGFDFLIVGAGFAGSVLAERLANVLGQRVLIVDKRQHIGGNAYDRYDDHGVLVHPYGPHIFHTNSSDIFEYLSRSTQWRPYHVNLVMSDATREQHFAGTKAKGTSKLTWEKATMATRDAWDRLADRDRD